ncbi:hypothetical protein QAD02_007493 [Eretmocerus hayati]|uniref:Uncharacterized protein n=1 Tax=Eretmocerus hayati TaxID=131215 RepID=A0ACC2N556_9HYME|nr:hypothetical protein QAD02_007493 [Eretmocerus hayati]
MSPTTDSSGTFEPEWLRVDNDEAVLVEMRNQFGPKGEPLFRIGFRCWIPCIEAGSDAEWVAELDRIKMEGREITIMWPMEVNIKNFAVTDDDGTSLLKQSSLIKIASNTSNTNNNEDPENSKRLSIQSSEEKTNQVIENSDDETLAIPLSSSFERKSTSVNFILPQNLSITSGQQRTKTNLASPATVGLSSPSDVNEQRYISLYNEKPAADPVIHHCTQNDDDTVGPKQSVWTQPHGVIASENVSSMALSEEEGEKIHGKADSRVEHPMTDQNLPDLSNQYDKEKSELSKSNTRESRSLRGISSADTESTFDSGIPPAVKDQSSPSSSVECLNLSHPCSDIPEQEGDINDGREEIIPGLVFQPVSPPLTSTAILPEPIKVQAQVKDAKLGGGVSKSAEELLKELEETREELRAVRDQVLLQDIQLTKATNQLKDVEKGLHSAVSDVLRPALESLGVMNDSEACEVVSSNSTLSSCNGDANMTQAVADRGKKLKRKHKQKQTKNCAGPPKKLRKEFPCPTKYELERRVMCIVDNANLTVKKVVNEALPVLFTAEELGTCCLFGPRIRKTNPPDNSQQPQPDNSQRPPLDSERLNALINRCWKRFGGNAAWYDDFKEASKKKMVQFRK